MDARFSKIAEKLRKNDAEIIPDLKNLLSNVEEVDSMLDIKAWMEPYLIQMSHHTWQHHYKFMNIDGEVACKYKVNQSSTWTQLDTQLVSQHPPRQPNILDPTFDHIDYHRLKKQVQAANYLFSSSEKVNWWNNFIVRLEKPHKRSQRQKWLNSLPKQARRDTTQSERDTIVLPQIQQMINKETEARQVWNNKIYFYIIKI